MKRTAGSDAALAGDDPAEQVLERHRLRELRRAAPRPVDAGRTGVASASSTCGEEPGIELAAPCRRRRVAACSTRAATSRCPAAWTSSALRRPRLPHAVEDLAERGHAVARAVREVRAAVERRAVGRQEDRHRPAALPGHRLDGAHVDRVEVGPLLAVDLDRHEALVEQPRRRLVLERLALHDVAPVARGVADRQEDRPVEGPRPGERLGPPRVPIDRVVGVLEEVRAGLAGQAVGHGSDGSAGAAVHR